MEINWFTYFAQIVNFLILIALLQKFLYEPITRAMTQRKLQIKATIDEANEKIITAEKELEKYRQENIRLQKEKDEIVLQARKEAELEREKILAKIDQEIEVSKAKWYENIVQERDEFLSNVRRRTLEEVYRVLRLSLQDLANCELEEQILNVFLLRLEQERDKLVTINSDVIKVSSAFSLTDNQKEKISQVIKKYTFNNNEIVFEVDSILVCGISLSFAGQEIVWSLENYLNNLADNLNMAMEIRG